MKETHSATPQKGVVDLGIDLLVKEDYPLCELTTIGCGGPADYVAFCRTGEEVARAVDYCRREQLEYFVLGGGSNVLAADRGFRGMVILVEIDSCTIEGESVTCGAGMSLHELVEQTTTAGLAGLETLAGIAGTVGGAVAGNAGAYGQSIADTLLEVDLYDPNEGMVSRPNGALDFRYRHSNLKNSGAVILSARFKLKRGNADELKQKVEAILVERWTKLPQESISAGCFFKNIEKADAPHGKLAAGYLLDQVGAKQMSCGKAGVYPGHANVLINKGGAQASEIRELSVQLKEKVKQSFGIDLVEEVVLLGDFS
ncbi:MAG: UDP-N-acetylmuramate dehydrogenase [bacterium]